MRAVITAGGTIDGAYADAAGTTVKALASVRGRTMLDRAIDAARGAGAREIAVVGGVAVRAACERSVEHIVDASSSGAENVRRALTAWPDDEPFVYLTSDMPYVDATSLEDFVRRSGEALTMPVTLHERFARRFPQSPPFGIRMGRERVVNGGAFFVPAGAGRRVALLATALFEARKSPLRMARVAGIALLVRHVAGTLSIERIERRANEVLGMRVQAVRDCAPELAYDADDVAAYRYACEHS